MENPIWIVLEDGGGAGGLTAVPWERTMAVGEVVWFMGPDFLHVASRTEGEQGHQVVRSG